MLALAATEQQLIQQLVETLQALPSVHADLARREPAGQAHDRGYDAEIDIRIAAKSLTLLVEAKKTVYPRDVQQLLATV